MKLLVVTQVMNQEHPVLGFFHHWVETFAPHFEHIHVICLEEGVHALPQNVTVHSLGKEKGASRFMRVVKFLQLSWGLSKDYDAVFVHMNPEYLALSGDFWRFTGKKVGLWYNHEVGSIWLKLAQPIVHTLFYTSPYAYPARYKNAQKMPAGIDTTLFTSGSAVRRADSIYFQGRISPAKRVHVLLEALRIVRRTRKSATVTLVGPEDAAYGATLRTVFKDLIEAGAVTFMGPKRNEETPALYGAHAVSVNLTADGNFDKTVLESLACETPAIVSSRAFEGLVPDEWRIAENDSEALAVALLRALSLSAAQLHTLGANCRNLVVQKHSLTSLADELAQAYNHRAH
ncbi:MAG TPA: glycosyltransferase family 4 protein [Candidatus Paceibacterota bacterium]|nr:glycosyltransferase family 4 protein [Candidatus Paceibacterota bacterium]